MTLPLMISVTITDRSGRTLVGPDARRVLHLDRARAAVVRRHQLRARRARHAAVPRRARAPGRMLGERAIRTPACPTPSASTTSSRTETARAAPRLRRERLREHPRRLLRHDARSHRARLRDAAVAGRRRRGCQLEADRRRDGLPSLAISRGSPASSRSSIRPDSNFQMIGERTNVTGSQQVRPADQGRQLRPRPRPSRSSRCAAAPTSST